MRYPPTSRRCALLNERPGLLAPRLQVYIQEHAAKPSVSDRPSTSTLFEQYKRELLEDLNPTHRLQYEDLSESDQRKWLHSRVQERIDRERGQHDQTAMQPDSNAAGSPSNAITKWDVGHLSTESWVPWFDKEREQAPPRQYRATTRIKVTFKDFRTLSELCLDWSVCLLCFPR